ncbi:hypothetical protein [Flexibacter flexilis]|uniref:hypothetical protein n=1 Tax=Flexibacter flexilis TaxID=998 RepID=UPI000B82A839|nr:hypothetical protein [Flexibacter flexilis]
MTTQEATNYNAQLNFLISKIEKARELVAKHYADAETQALCRSDLAKLENQLKQLDAQYEKATNDNSESGGSAATAQRD